ncbi:MAG: prephenate dehydrogenase/arogenate dehydrogenase family protein [Desulfuromonadales bacterium]|nr:prephenate dehydrogenase/arogenate dehydrogenase family protein [Desulfuromonadales bacterium]
MSLINNLTVIGVGLIGGSFARALKDKGAVKEITGVDIDPLNLKKALELKVIDRAETQLPASIKEADVVFIATPVRTIAGIVKQIAPFLKQGAVVTDGGSVKSEIVELCDRLIPEGRYFVGGHPIAGTENSGVEASYADLYKGKRCILTPTANTDSSALEKIVKVWEAVGSEVVFMDSVKHDKLTAAISHLPHMVAYTLVNTVGEYEGCDENILKYSAGGFRDFTRIASSDPKMWRDIALQNKKPIIEMMDYFTEHYSELKNLIVNDDSDGLEEFFARSRSHRESIL